MVTDYQTQDIKNAGLCRTEVIGMGFTSYRFIFVFMPILLAGWNILGKSGCKRKYSNFFLFIMSVIFAWGGVQNNWKSFLLLLVTIVINWICTSVMRLVSPKAGFWIAFCNIAGNVGMLVFFKYADWIRRIFDPGADAWKLLLPLGISFYTLEQIMYVMDCYRDRSVRYHFLEFTVYSTFFPAIASGPILRHDVFIGQLRENNRSISDENLAQGMISVCLGMGKKVLIAAQLSKFADYGYQNVNDISTLTAVLCMITYSLQLYFDFSGYCNMAEGIAQMLGFELPQNFDSPYQALSIGEFWKKWHMTLTSFLTRYIYIPLGGNRKGRIRQSFHIMCVFIISGFWHGASWCFVIWGILHGICMVLDKLTGKIQARLPDILKRSFTFGLVSLLWVPFRSASLADAKVMLFHLFQGTMYVDDGFWNQMMSGSTGLLNNLGYITYDTACFCRKILSVLFLFLLLMVVFHGKNVNALKKRYCGNIWFAVFCGMTLFFSVIQFTSVTSFIYEGF